MGFPAVSLRDSIERPEALDAGSIVMTGLDVSDVLQALNIVVGQCRGELEVRPVPAGYEITDTYLRAVRFIVSAEGRHHHWAGIRE